MKNLRFIMLLAILVVASTSVWMLNSEQEDEGGRLLFPDLTIDYLNTVETIKIIQHNSSPINVYLADDNSWRVAEHHDYPADTVKIRGLLFSLQDAEKVEEKTSLAEHYAQLGVADPDAEDGSGKLMMFKTPDEEFGLIVGKQSQQISAGQYVRKHDEAESWLVNTRFDLPGDTIKWLDREMIHIEPGTVSTVSVTHSADDESFTVIRDDAEELTIENLAEGQVIYQKDKLNSIVAVTDYLYFKDVIPQDQINLPEEYIRVNVKTKESAFVDIKAYQTEDGKHYFIASTNSTPHQGNFSGWAFEVPDVVYDGINKRLSDFLATVPAPPPEEALDDTEEPAADSQETPVQTE